MVARRDTRCDAKARRLAFAAIQGKFALIPPSDIEADRHMPLAAIAQAKQLDATVEIGSDCRGTATTITHATFKSKPMRAA
jgi:hypothetical protein